MWSGAFRFSRRPSRRQSEQRLECRALCLQREQRSVELELELFGLAFLKVKCQTRSSRASEKINRKRAGLVGRKAEGAAGFRKRHEVA